ncbi:hypothetical protein K438DRAFT_1785574 [Mycena galopus ATCC 62051]|nr:hypothetical protein K438DRAFT_1785574 [Mycena galopus ATCC 62051]
MPFPPSGVRVGRGVPDCYSSFSSARRDWDCEDFLEGQPAVERVKDRGVNRTSIENVWKLAVRAWTGGVAAAKEDVRKVMYNTRRDMAGENPVKDVEIDGRGDNKTQSGLPTSKKRAGKTEKRTFEYKAMSRDKQPPCRKDAFSVERMYRCLRGSTTFTYEHKA